MLARGEPSSNSRLHRCFHLRRHQSRPAWDKRHKSCTRVGRKQACQCRGVDHNALMPSSFMVRIMPANNHSLFCDRNKSRKHAVPWKWHGVPREPVAQAELCGSKHRRWVSVAIGGGMMPPEPTTWRHHSERSDSSGQFQLACLIRTELPRVIAETHVASKPGSIAAYSNALGRDSQTMFSKLFLLFSKTDHQASFQGRGEKACRRSKPTPGHDEGRQYD